MGNARKDGEETQYSRYYGDRGIAAVRIACGLEPLRKDEGEVTCLTSGCGRTFLSEDRKKFRICPRCKSGGKLSNPTGCDDIYPGISHVPPIDLPGESRVKKDLKGHMQSQSQRTLSRPFARNRVKKKPSPAQKPVVEQGE